MPRPLLTIVLLFALLLHGCAHQKQAETVPDTDQELAQTLRKYSRSDGWFENWPVMVEDNSIANRVLVGSALALSYTGLAILCVAAALGGGG